MRRRLDHRARLARRLVCAWVRHVLGREDVVPRRRQVLVGRREGEAAAPVASLAPGRCQEDDARRQEGGEGDVDWRECGAIRAHVASSGSTGHVGQTIGSGHGSGCDANARRSAGSEYSISSRRREDERCGEGVAGVSIRGARALLGKLWLATTWKGRGL